MICIPQIAEKRIVKHEIVGKTNREFYCKRHLMNFVRKGKSKTECKTRELLFRLIPATIIVVSMVSPLCSLCDVY